MGLRTHPEKTKNLSNQSLNNRKEIEIVNIKVEISTNEESTKYLGQAIAVQQQETTEIRSIDPWLRALDAALASFGAT